jgi:phosphatidylinositol 4-kinase
MKNYRSIFKVEDYLPAEALQNTYANINGEVEFDQAFLSCIHFWEDLIEIADNLSLANPKILALNADLRKIN